LVGVFRGQGMVASLVRLGVLLAVIVAIVWHTSGSARGAGALAVGRCGAYGNAYDYPTQGAAAQAAKAKCDGACTTVTMKHACAAFAVDIKNPCGSFGYAVAPQISSALNTSMKNCYKFGGHDCVIRTWACDAKG
jgi:Domain of unknown function (DUF4189)